MNHNMNAFLEGPPCVWDRVSDDMYFCPDQVDQDICTSDRECSRSIFINKKKNYCKCANAPQTIDMSDRVLAMITDLSPSKALMNFIWQI